MRLRSIAIFWMAAAAYGSSIVIPGADAASEGDTNNVFPFDINAAGLSSQRYQQVYAGSAFGTTPILISGIDFREDGPFGAANPGGFSSTLPSIQIDLSTTSAAVDALSTTFASNVGANDTVVYADGPLSLSSADSGSPPAFDIHIQFSTSFLYDPTAGNLLLDVRNFSGGSTAVFDAEDTPGDAISRVYTYTNASGVNAATADGADSFGLVTQFDYGTSSVPEPATGLLSAAGLAAAFVMRRRYR